MKDSGMLMALVATAAALLGVIAGLSLSAFASGARRMVAFSGGLLMGVALFGLLPELMEEIGIIPGALLLGAGYLALLLIDRYAYSVCPTCSHSHDHDACASTLHGFAAPLITAAAFHAFLDGWGIATSQSSAAADLRLALPIALALHKIPEGVALGAILRASMKSRRIAFGWCLLAESVTILGAGTGLAMAHRVAGRWLHYPLAAAGGCFLYLGYHAIEADWRKRPGWAALIPGVTGAAGAAVLQRGVETFLR